MLKLVDRTLDKLSKSLGKVLGFYAQSTSSAKYLTSKVFFIRCFFTSFSQARLAFTQLQNEFLNLLFLVLYPSFTGPITNTNLIKELYS
jgi:hypothetical protein